MADSISAAVHSDVAAADDGHLLAREVGVIAIADASEQVNGRKHAFGIRAVDAQALTGLRADSHVHGVVIRGKLRHALGVHGAFGMHGDTAHGQDAANILVQALAREAVRGDAVADHAAQLLAPLEHVHVVAHQGGEVRAGQTGRAAAHDRHRAGQTRGLAAAYGAQKFQPPEHAGKLTALDRNFPAPTGSCGQNHRPADLLHKPRGKRRVAAFYPVACRILLHCAVGG